MGNATRYGPDDDFQRQIQGGRLIPLVREGPLEVQLPDGRRALNTSELDFFNFRTRIDEATGLALPLRPPPTLEEIAARQARRVAQEVAWAEESRLTKERQMACEAQCSVATAASQLGDHDDVLADSARYFGSAAMDDRVRFEDAQPPTDPAALKDWLAASLREEDPEVWEDAYVRRAHRVGSVMGPDRVAVAAPVVKTEATLAARAVVPVVVAGRYRKCGCGRPECSGCRWGMLECD